MQMAIFLILGVWILDLIFGSFLLDPFLLIISGIVIFYVCSRFLNKRFISLLYLLTILIFYAGSLSLYFNLPYANFLYRIAEFFPLMGSSPSGFNFMINSGIFHIPYTKPEDAPFYLHLVAGFIFATYPVWLYLGIKSGEKIFKK